MFLRTTKIYLGGHNYTAQEQSDAAAQRNKPLALSCYRPLIIDTRADGLGKG